MEIKVEVVNVHENGDTLRATLRVHCERRCHVPLRQGGCADQKPQGGPFIWGWDGNVEKPTIAPSVHCSGPRYGCGRHFTVVEGEVRQA